MIALYPWETVEAVEREQIEAEILADTEFQQWLDELWADSCWLEAASQQPTDSSQQLSGMSELEFMEYTFQQLTAQISEKMPSFADVMLRAPRTGGWDLLPEWQRDGYVGM